MGDITTLLARARDGEITARDALFARVYDELRRLARARLARETAPVELDATALVHETYLRLTQGAALPDGDRRAFFALAATIMRNVLVDQARQRQSAKRGSGLAPLTLITQIADAGDARSAEIEALDGALHTLRQLDARCHDVVELRYFGGLSLEEVADVLGLSLATVKRDWQKARAFLFKALRSEQ